MPPRRDAYDAVIIGSGPNGLIAAIELARTGASVLVIEAADRPGGGMRSEELIETGCLHDVCSAVHPLACASPAFTELGLEDFGVEWVHPDLALAHPLDIGDSAFIDRSMSITVSALEQDHRGDGSRWEQMMRPVATTALIDDLLAPLSPPRHPIALARFARWGLRSAASVITRDMGGRRSAALLAGLAAHSTLALDRPGTAGYAIVLGGLAHRVGWPIVAGGSQQLANALVAILERAGGQVVYGCRITSYEQVPSAPIVMADTSPRAVIDILGDRLPARFRRRLAAFRHGPGVFKIDWILDGPVPWSAPDVHRAATVHVGGTASEIIAAEAAVAAGEHPRRPFVIVVQPSSFDASRTPDDRQVLWAYCHVPAGSTVDMTAAIEAQIERFAPGFAARIRARHIMTTRAVAAHGLNYIGGDINGGSADLAQFFARPRLSLRPWRLPVEGWYLCSSSTPPGGGVHGMGGRAAVRCAIGARSFSRR